MRKLKLQMQISIDGFVASTSGEMDWLTWDWDDELKRYVIDLTEPVDRVLLGRKLAEGFIPHWAAAAKEENADIYTRRMGERPKTVFSNTLQSNAWGHETELASGDLTEEITKIKQQEGGDLIVYGGGNFVSNLIKKGLIDEYHLFVNPVILGQGMPIFQGLDNQYKMKLLYTRQFQSGITVLCYQPV